MRSRAVIFPSEYFPLVRSSTGYAEKMSSAKMCNPQVMDDNTFAATLYNQNDRLCEVVMFTAVILNQAKTVPAVGFTQVLKRFCCQTTSLRDKQRS